VIEDDAERPRARRRRRASALPGELDDAVPMSDALAIVGDELGLADPAAVAALTQRWEEVVGPAVAPHARLRSLRGGVLMIAVDAAPWATELRYLEETLRARVAEVAGSEVVRSVRVVVDAPA
jgi:predicted nucleic acid-binding Zn ribbon protein